MIDRDTIKRNIDRFKIEQYIAEELDKPGYSHTEIQKTPLGEKIIIHTSKPGLIVGRKGESVRKLTEVLKTRFGLENPQIEITEVTNPFLNPHSVAKGIIHTFNRFGPKRFKMTGHKSLQNIINAGALGAEIVIAGRGVPSSRSRTWRFSAGYLKKSGDIAENFIKKGSAVAHLKSGSVGVKVSILTPDIDLPDKVVIYDKSVQVEESSEEKTETKTEKKNEVSEKKTEEKSTDKKETKVDVKDQKEAKEKEVPKASELKEKKETKVDVKDQKEAKEKEVPKASELKDSSKKQDGNNKKE
ncbi:30S ribosomal protein S3 [archaeon]|jgi:small subunit ribosomal protein S3|nr:30S ribosomal protein S3 [archaeon]MBT7107232.1 30S ribosomal protein S3 [archaeon]MBT7297153.1 30S ribosomal protein S3 [archaeon]